MIGDTAETPHLSALLQAAGGSRGLTVSGSATEDDDIILGPTEGEGNRDRIQVIRLEGRMQRRPDFWGRLFGSRQGPYQAFATLVDKGIREGHTGLAYTVSSPGGSPKGLTNAVQAVIRAREAYGDGRVWALAAENAESAAYPLLAAAGPGQVYAEPDATVGSLGVFLAVEDASEMGRQIGLEVVKATGGQELKAPGAPFGVPISEEQREWMSSMAEAMREGVFFPLIAGLRGMSLAAVREMAGEGQTFTAQQALDRGLIDQIATEASFFAAVTGQEAVPMPDTPGEMPTTPTTPEPAEAEAPQVVEASATPATPEPPGESPPEPKAATPRRAATPTASAAESSAEQIAALTELVRQQGEQIAAQTAQISELATSVQAGRRQEQLDAYRSRLEAAGSLPPGQADDVMATITAQIDAGLPAEHQERIVALHEARPDQTELLREEIDIGGEAQTVDLSWAADRDGTIPPEDRQRVRAVAAAVAGKAPREALAALRDRVLQGRA